jgi:hypothetical protein
MYEPPLGRFTSVDPVTASQESLSTYQYGWNNPVLRSDRNGDCPNCPPYTNPMQPLLEGFGQIVEAAAVALDRLSIVTTTLVENTFNFGKGSTTVSNLTTTETSTNAYSNLSYMKVHNTNEGNTTPMFKTSVKNETMVSSKKEADFGVAKVSMKASTSIGGNTKVENKAEFKLSKAWTTSISGSKDSDGSTKVKVEGKTGLSSGNSKIFTQISNTLKNISAEIGVGYEQTKKTNKTETKVENTFSIKYTQPK